MIDFSSVLSKEEITAFTLCALYDGYGYKKYRMSKFEEYDLYVQNKDYLISENVITFTDTDGKLLALKPDVTLSIIKNSKDVTDGVMKVYYNENVYRVSKGARSFREIMQAGIEALGSVDNEVIAEVLLLASKSLAVISDSSVLELSSLDIVIGVLNACSISEMGKKQILDYLGQKNLEGVLSVCESEGLDSKRSELVSKLVTVCGNSVNVKSELNCFVVDETTFAAVKSLLSVIDKMDEYGVSDRIRIDFSVVSDTKYYNGIAFKGFVEGVPTSVISGGQYDNLMAKMNRKLKAVGFAVYLDGIDKQKLEI